MSTDLCVVRRKAWKQNKKDKNFFFLYGTQLCEKIAFKTMLPIILLSWYPLHRENRENGQKNSLSGKTQGIWKFCQNTGNFVCSSCKFPDSKSKGYCDICHESFHFSPRRWKGLLVSVVYVIVTNYVNWHRENLRLDRGKTGKTQGI